MENLEDYDLIDLEDMIIMLPEQKYYEAAAYIYRIRMRRDMYIADALYFNFSDGEWGNIKITTDWYYKNQDDMDLFENNQYQEDYRRMMIEIMFENPSEGLVDQR